MNSQTQTNGIEALKFSLKRQNEQGNAMMEMLDEVQEIKNEVKQTESNIQKIDNDMNEKIEKVNDSLERMENSVELQGSEADEIQSIIYRKAHELAIIKFPDMDDYGAEYRELNGYARRRLYKKLKTHFNVNSYSKIRHVDFEDAKDYAQSIKFDNSFFHEFKKWKDQKLKKEQRERAKQKENENK